MSGRTGASGSALQASLVPRFPRGRWTSPVFLAPQAKKFGFRKHTDVEHDHDIFDEAFGTRILETDERPALEDIDMNVALAMSVK